MNKLSDTEVTSRLEKLSGWTREGESLRKVFDLPGFKEAIALVDRVAVAANEADHHPDMLIQYSKLTFVLSTHDAGGITAKDFELAAAIEALAR